jgi:hypothetical protein
MPVKPKYLAFIAILVAIAFAATFLFKSDAPQDLLKAAKQPK